MPTAKTKPATYLVDISNERALSWLPSVPSSDPVEMAFVTNTGTRWNASAKSSTAVDRVRRALHETARSLRNLMSLSGSGVKFGDAEIRVPPHAYLTFLWATHQLPSGEAPAMDEVSYGGVMIRPTGMLPWQK